jgi:hypothetical protein
VMPYAAQPIVNAIKPGESALAHKRRTGRPPQQARSEFTQP